MSQLTTRGTFYDVGYNVGLQFAPKIQNFFEGCQKPVVAFYDSPVGREFYEKNLRVCQTAYPQYVSELRGLADGSGTAFEHIFTANVQESALIIPLPDQSSGGGAGCTALMLVDQKQHQYVLHNEDMWSQCKEGYLLTAQIEEDGFERENFTSFCYPGYLPNWAYGFNEHGLTFCVNAIHPAHDLLCEAPGIKFVLRSVIRARDVAEVVELAKNAPHGVGYSCVINVTTKNGQMTSIEVGPGKPEGLVHVHDVTAEGKKPQGPDHYYHFNVYKHLKVEEWHGRARISSEHRLARTNSLPPPCDLQAALAVMADTHDPQWSIFRTPCPGKQDLLETVCTAVFDVTGRELWVFQGRDDLLTNKPLTKLRLP